MAPSGSPRFARNGTGAVAIGGPLQSEARRNRRMVSAMSTPNDVPELAIPQDAGVDEAEAARCLEVAARMVQEFSAAGGSGALNDLLAIAVEAPAGAAEHALHLAESVAGQTATLHDEVTRFLSAIQEY